MRLKSGFGRGERGGKGRRRGREEEGKKRTRKRRRRKSRKRRMKERRRSVTFLKITHICYITFLI